MKIIIATNHKIKIETKNHNSDKEYIIKVRKNKATILVALFFL